MNQLSLFEIQVETIEEMIQREVTLIGDDDSRIERINKIKVALHEVSPLKHEPVDLVIWVKSDLVEANDYNPNSVAPPEMELLRHSINHDGYTQPVVTWIEDGRREVIDGFHRARVCKEMPDVRDRVKSYLPVVTVRAENTGKVDRIASTIRHNRARGKHKVDSMSDIVVELKNRNWTNDRISRELGMDQDEVLRLCQITGLAGLFSDQEFSKSWDIEDSEPEYVPLTEEFEESESDNFRTVNTNDPGRIFRRHEEWECYKAGFYATTMDGVKKEECEKIYMDFLSNRDEFGEALKGVISEWKNSCEHYLTNSAMNRIAWLGQAACCYARGIPSTFRGGFNLLSEQQQKDANQVALIYLNKWLELNGRALVDMGTALSDNQMDLY